jgi:cellulose synthase operon protein C
VLLAAKSFEQAAAAYAHANKMAPSSVAVLREYRARVLGRLPGATAPLENRLRSNPADVAARLVLAEALAANGDAPRAIEHYQVLTKGPNPNLAALNNLAWLYHETSDERAIETAEQAFRLSPKTPAVADTLGWILVQSGDKARGLGILKDAAAMGTDPEIRYHYGVALAESGDRASARREFEAIVREASGSPAAAKAKEFLSRVGG